ncbi:MAG: sodium-dependent transporter, partial [Prevotellaceae bacterium]|nr:sodium-dependent transporter [Prevotellaceae bacterium]
WATAIAAIFSAAAGVVCSLSFGVLSDFKIFEMTFFELMDFFASNVLLPLGSFLLVLFAGWRLKKSVMYKELYTGSRKSIKKLSIVMFFILKYIAPFAIILVFLYGLGVFNFLK